MILVLFFCSVLAASAAGQQTPAVNIAQGIVVGSAATDGDYFEFHGIPYAGSTSGTNRFKAPLPAPSFEVPFVANRKDIKCVRALGAGFEGTEDCLVANIFTPALNNTRRMPVMVWIKGKEFDRVNGGELSFRNFVEKEVVVVSLNYRESILGFLCLGTQTAPGNAGLKDIIAGLKWVQANIAQFGGNPKDITLFGHGSGAAAVDLVTMSPMGQGLVQKAIAQSGNALAPWAVSRDNLEHALKVAEALGHEIENIQQLSDVFTRTSVSTLMGVINELDLTDNSLAFAPCVERQELEGVEPFLIKTPAEIIRDAEFLQIPIIISFVDNEGIIRSEEAVDDDWLERMDETFTKFIQPDLKFDTEAEQALVAQRIRDFYFKENPIDMNHVKDYIKYHGDTMMLVSSIREARNRMFASSSPVYLFQFSYSGTLGKPFVGPINVDSAAHSEELAYMFHNSPDTENSERDLSIGSILVERWTNFAKTGNPESTTSQIPWLPLSRLNFNYLRVLSNSEIFPEGNVEVPLQNPYSQTVNFWEHIYFSYFLDAQSSWSIIDRLEPTTTEDPTADTTITPPGDDTPADPGTDDTTTAGPGTDDTITVATNDDFNSTDTNTPDGVTTPSPSTDTNNPGEVTTPSHSTNTNTPDGVTTAPSTDTNTPGGVTTAPPSTDTNTPDGGTTPSPSTDTNTPDGVTTTSPSTDTNTPDGVTTPSSSTDTSTPDGGTTPSPSTDTSTPDGVTTTSPSTDTNTPDEVTTPSPSTDTSTPDGVTTAPSSTDANTPDGVTTASPSTDTNTPDGVTTPSPSTDTNTPDGVTTTSPSTDTNTPDGVTTPSSSTDTSTPDGGTTPSPSTDTSTPDGVTTTSPSTDTNTPDEVTTPSPSTDTSTPDGVTTAPSSTDANTPDGVTTASPSTDTNTPDGVTTASPSTDTNTPEGDTTEDITTDGGATEDPTTDESTTEVPPESGESDEDPNSASSAVASTFLIISLFSLLSHFHSSQVL